MLRSRGISERVVYAYNPLPAVSEAKLLEAAKLDDLIAPSKQSPFRFTWKYGSGLTMESVDLLPGDFLALRESEARELMNSTNAAELGICIVPVNDVTNADTRKLVIAALAKAAQFYFDRGRKQLMNLRKKHAYTEQDMDDVRHQFHPYVLNQAKEQVIRQYLETLKAKPGKAA